MDIDISQHNDDQIPLIPITPVEDEDAPDTTPDPMGSSMVPMSSQGQLLTFGVSSSQCSIPSISNTPVNGKPMAGVLLGVEPDAIAAAFAAVNKSNEQGNLIDHDLLIKILSNPKLIEKLVTDYGAAGNAQNIPKPSTSDSSPPPLALPSPTHMQMNRIESNTQPLSAATSSGSFYTQPNGVGMGVVPNAWIPPSAPSTPPIGASQAKDINYYKNLIQQHGSERQETPQQFGSRYNHQVGTSQDLVNPKTRESKPKIMKPCIYFNSSRGCRNGANCAYQHDASSQQKGSSMPEVQSAKRMKMDREISS